MEKIKKYAPLFLLICCAAGVALIWYAVFYIEAHRDLVMTVFDIGQGDSIFIEMPNGNQVLIDGGPDDAVLAKLGAVLPFWNRTLDLVILTHPHADHVTGLISVLKRYHVGMVLESGVNYATPEYDEWRLLEKEKNVPVVIAHRGQVVHLSSKTQLNILTPFDSFIGASPKNVHDAMVVAKLRDGSATALLTGDAEKPLEYQLLFAGDNLASDVLKVGHHGSKTSTTEDFLQAVSPKIAVISVGRKNRYGHPAPEVVDRIAAFGAALFRTDRDHDVRFESDGKIFVRTE